MAKPAHYRIFVVDDEPIIATTLAIILQRSGFISEAFTNPLDVLKRCDSDPPDLLLTDVVMPHISGIDLAIQVREKSPNCRVLLFSGQAATADLLSAAREQGHDFDILSKPIHPTDLLSAVTTASRTGSGQSEENSEDDRLSA